MPSITQSSSLKEEPPLRTKLLFLSFALVVILPVVQSGSIKTEPNNPGAYVVIAEAGPGLSTNMRRMPGQIGNPAGHPRGTYNAGSNLGMPSDLGLGVMTLARSFLMWMGL